MRDWNSDVCSSDLLVVDGPVLVGVAKGEARLPGDETLLLPGVSGQPARELHPGAASPGLQLVQQVRDEAHRFAITGHRGRRQKARSSSRLEDIAGIGPRRRASLLKHFGGLGGLKKDRKSTRLNSSPSCASRMPS